MKRIITIFIGIILCLSSFAQQTDSLKYKQIHFIKLNQANDLFTLFFQSDKYYTDGVDIEFAHQIFGNKVADKILLGFNGTPYQDFSLSFNQDMYTPENNQVTTVDSSDRPYAGQLFVAYAKYSNQFWKGKKLTTKLYFGFQGPMAFAGKSQNFVHGSIGNDSILGWDNQLSNGLILDYEVQYMQLIPVSSPITELHYFANLHLGTLNTFTELGLRFKIGHYTDSYMNFYGIANKRNHYKFTAKDIARMSPNRRKTIPKRIRQQSLEDQAKYFSDKMNRKFQFYFFTEGIAAYILRDGSVEGSLIQFSPNIYEYNYSDYNHFEWGGRYGIVLQYSGFYMEFARYLHTDDYRESGFFGYGRMILGWVF